MTSSKKAGPQACSNLTPTFPARLHLDSAKKNNHKRRIFFPRSTSTAELCRRNCEGGQELVEQGDGVDQELVLRAQFCLKSPDTSRVSDLELPAPNVTWQTSSITPCSNQGTKSRLLGYPRSLPRLDPGWHRYPRP